MNDKSSSWCVTIKELNSMLDDGVGGEGTVIDRRNSNGECNMYREAYKENLHKDTHSLGMTDHRRPRRFQCSLIVS